MIGDMLLCVGYMSYMGPFPGKYRRETILRWRKIVKSMSITFDDNFSFIGIMGQPVEIINWISNGLPNDDLSKENTIIMQVSDFFPLIIDPQKQAMKFFNVYESDRKQVVVEVKPSAKFAGQLGNTIRNGETLFLKNIGETLDPVLNDVLLNSKMDRRIIEIGTQSIKWNPTFFLFLISY